MTEMNSVAPGNNAIPATVAFMGATGKAVRAGVSAALPVGAAAAPGAVAVTIGAGQSLSDTIDLDTVAGRAHRISFPEDFAWTAATLTILSSFDGGVFNTVHRLNDDGSTSSAGLIQAAELAARRSIVLPADVFYAVRFIRFLSGTVATPVAQAAARTFSLVLAPR